MALHTIFAFGVLCAGLLAARPNHFVAGLLKSSGPGGQSARRMLPATVVLVLAVFAARWLGEGLGLYGEEFGVVFSGCLVVGLLAAIIVWNASALDVADRTRQRADNELRRLNRALRVLSECNQALLRTTSERELMTSVCRTIVEIGGCRFAWAGFALPDNPDVLEPVAHWGHEDGYLEVLRQVLRTGQSRSLAARAIRAGGPTVVHDMASDPILGPWREEALKRGYASAIALPLVRDARLLGSLNIYSAQKDAFDQQEADLLFELAHDLAFGIETLRVRVEHEKLERELERFFSLSLDLLCVTDSQGCFKRLNPAFEEVSGCRLDELLGRSLLEFVHPEDRERTSEHFASLKSGLPWVRFESRFTREDGSFRWLSWSAHPPLPDGLIYAVARDISERTYRQGEIQKLNAELEQRVAERTASLSAANRDLEAFSYSVSHDLRAPIRHMEGFARILSEECAGQLDEQARHYVSRILDGAHHMARLVEDMLNLSHTGRREIQPQLAGLNSLVEEALRELAHETNGRRVEWRIGKLPFVECDPALVKQVFINLLGNALKFTRPREQAVIEVGEELRNGRPCITVRDNGVGFNMKYADKLFKLFQRLHRPEDFEGTGVGLVTVERIIQKHGGSVWAEAEVGKGACFYFTLERRAVTEPESAARAAGIIAPR